MYGKKGVWGGLSTAARHSLLVLVGFVAICVVYLASAGPAAGQATSAPPVNVTAPTMSGVVRQGQTLSVSNGSWSGVTPISFSVTWQRCDATGANCTAISGATALTYALASADVGNTVRVLVVASNSDGSAQALTQASAVVAAPGSAPASTVQPNPAGTAQSGQTVTVDNGSWNGDQPMSYTYQWQRCTSVQPVCTDIVGATSQSYKVSSADVGYALRAKVTATNDLGSSSVTSNLTAVVVVAGLPPVNTALPLIVGSPAVGTTLHAGLGIWTGASAGGYTYQWNRCNSSGTGCSSIPGAIGPTYLVSGQDTGKTIRLTVTATNQAGSTSATSVATESIPVKTVSVLKLAATLTVGQVVPRPVATKAGASGSFTATLTGSTLRWTLKFANLTGPVSATEINAGTLGKSGPLLFGLSGRTVSPVSGTSTVSRAEIGTLVRGGAYVTVLTGKNPNGELRGQIAPAL